MKTYRGFFDSTQLNNYLSGSIIRYNMEPIYILSASFLSNTICAIRFLYLEGDKRQDEKHLECDLKDLDLAPVPLGILVKEQKGKASILYNAGVISRLPVRAWKIGLAPENVSITPINSSCFDRSSSLILSKELRNTIRGNYTSFQDVLEKLNKKENEGVIPFNRFFAIKKGTTSLKLIYYKYPTEPIGKIVQGKCELDKKFYYLNEHLEEALNG